MPWWDDLSDDELRARLVQRGVDLDVAEEYVRFREVTAMRAKIGRYLS